MSGLVHEPFSGQMMKQQIMILNQLLTGVCSVPRGLRVLPHYWCPPQGWGVPEQNVFPASSE